MGPSALLEVGFLISASHALFPSSSALDNSSYLALIACKSGFFCDGLTFLCHLGNKTRGLGERIDFLLRATTHLQVRVVRQASRVRVHRDKSPPCQHGKVRQSLLRSASCFFAGLRGRRKRFQVSLEEFHLLAE